MCTTENANDYDEKGTKLSVPGNDIAKLMYYLKCVSFILEMDAEPDIRYLTNFENYLSMSSADLAKIISLCTMASPDVLYNKFLFAGDQLGNKLYEIASSKNEPDQQSFVRFMVFDFLWLERNFVIPFRNIVEKLEKKIDCFF